MKTPPNQSQIDEYHPATCITAAEFRELGLPVPEDIPDCAWVPRNSFRFQMGEVHSEDPEAGKISAIIETVFTVPFKWIEVKVALDKPVPEEVLQDE